jgi:hypothetical protein
MKLSELKLNKQIDEGFTTVSNGEAFIEALGKAFGGQKNKTVVATITLKGTNVLHYRIEDKVDHEERLKTYEES